MAMEKGVGQCGGPWKVVELPWGGSVTKWATLSSLLTDPVYFSYIYVVSYIRNKIILCLSLSLRPHPSWSGVKWKLLVEEHIPKIAKLRNTLFSWWWWGQWQWWWKWPQWRRPWQKQPWQRQPNKDNHNKTKKKFVFFSSLFF